MDQIPGIGDRKLKPLDTKALQKESNEALARKVAELRRQGVPDDVIAQKIGPQSMTFQDQATHTLPQKQPEVAPPPKPPEAPIPEPDVPLAETFNANAGVPKDVPKHPVLQRLENAFGLKKLACKSVEVGSFLWTFRPPGFRSWEWFNNNVKTSVEGTVSPATLQVLSVSSALAAVDKTPLYEILGVDTLGRFIADPLNPPPDIRDEAATAALSWFRENLGLWELIGELDKEQDRLYDGEREKAYPLARTLGRTRTNPTTNGQPGDDVSPSSTGPQPTQEPGPSSTTPPPKSSISIGEIEGE